MKLKKVQKIWGILRISVGWVFLWAFLDKTFGLGFATLRENAWVLGNSPTSGFLQFATKGPFATIFQSMAGTVLVDWLVMLGFLGIGIALLFGVGIKIAGYSGALMMFLFYLAVLPPEHNPFLDEHIIYIFLLIGFTTVRCGEWFGFGKRWSKTKLVRKYPILK